MSVNAFRDVIPESFRDLEQPRFLHPRAGELPDGDAVAVTTPCDAVPAVRWYDRNVLLEWSAHPYTQFLYKVTELPGMPQFWVNGLPLKSAPEAPDHLHGFGREPFEFQWERFCCYRHTVQHLSVALQAGAIDVFSATRSDDDILTIVFPRFWLMVPFREALGIELFKH